MRRAEGVGFPTLRRLFRHIRSVSAVGVTPTHPDGRPDAVLVERQVSGACHLQAGTESNGDRRTASRFLPRRDLSVDLVNQLEQEKTAGRSGRLAEMLLRYVVIVIDDLGYLPFSQPGGQLLFHLISKLYENTSLLITTNLAFADWPHVSGDSTLS